MSENAKKASGQKKQAGGASVSVSKFMIVLAGIVTILLLIVNDSVTVDSLVARIASLDSTYTELQFRHDSLLAEVKRLSSAERITRIASKKLGFVYSTRTLEQIKISKSKLQEAAKLDARDSTK